MTRFAVYDRFGNYKHDLVNVVQCKRTRKTDGTNTLSITCLNTVDKDDRIVFKARKASTVNISSHSLPSNARAPFRFPRSTPSIPSRNLT